MSRKRMLYRYELSNVKWFLVAGLILCGGLLLSINSEYSSDMEVLWTSYNGSKVLRILFWGDIAGGSSLGSTLVSVLHVCTMPAIIFFGCMAAYQFTDYHKRDKREFMVSLPYTQQERFLAKLLVGFGTITGICLVFGIGILSLRAYYYPHLIKSYLVYPEYKLIMANDTWLHTIRTLLLLWIILLTAYAVYVLVHSLVIHGVAATLVGGGVMLSPAWLLYQIKAYEALFNDDSVGSITKWLWHHPGISRLGEIFLGGGYYRNSFRLNSEEYYEDLIGRDFVLIDYTSTTKVFVAVIVLLLACILLAWFVNARQDGARFGQVVPAKAVRIFLSAGIAVCFGLGILWIFILALGLGDALIISWLLVVLCVGLYLLANRILRRAVR